MRLVHCHLILFISIFHGILAQNYNSNRNHNYENGQKGDNSRDTIIQNESQLRTHNKGNNYGNNNYGNNYGNNYNNHNKGNHNQYHIEKERLKAQYLAEKNRLKNQYKPSGHHSHKHKPGGGNGQYYPGNNNPFKPKPPFKPFKPFKPIRESQNTRDQDRPEIVLIPSLSQIFGGGSRSQAAIEAENIAEYEENREFEENEEVGESGAGTGGSFLQSLASAITSGGSSSGGGSSSLSQGGGNLQNLQSTNGGTPLQALGSSVSGLFSGLQNFLPSFGANQNTNSAGSSLPSLPSNSISSGSGSSGSSGGGSSGDNIEFPILTPGSGSGVTGGNGNGGSGSFPSSPGSSQQGSGSDQASRPVDGSSSSPGVINQPSFPPSNSNNNNNNPEIDQGSGVDSQTQFPIISGQNSINNGGPGIGESIAGGLGQVGNNNDNRFVIPSTAIPRVVVDQIHKIVESVGAASIQGTVDSALKFSPDESVRVLVSGVLERLFCSPVGRITGQCLLPGGGGAVGGGKNNENPAENAGGGAEGDADQENENDD